MDIAFFHLFVFELEVRKNRRTNKTCNVAY